MATPFPRPGATNPPCQAPGLCSFIADFIVSQVNLRQRFVDFQCFGKGLWTTRMANHVKPENLQSNLPQYSHVHYHTLKPSSRGQDKTLKTTLLHICKNFCEYTLHLLAWNFSLALQVSELSPVPLTSSFHPISETLGKIQWPNTQTPEHLSNTANVSEVSNTTGTPLCSIFVHHFKTWSHRPPSQAPGLGSFLVNVIVLQVNVRQSFVDF